MKLPPEAKGIVETAYQKSYPCILATSSRDGKPDIGIKGSMMVFDDESLAYWERTKSTHLNNILANPNVAVICWDGQEKTGYRFFGTAVIANDEKIRDAVRERVSENERKLDPNKEGVVIIIRVSTVIPLGKAKQTFKPENASAH
ncbi:MAG: pyridoxamine 5'-phosphate oxidase family protein [Thaumarchaeota archaeon]|nr:pyridoxamine 5'-phosphate oxidase family protein [Nitrososphaerota archaeon]